MVAGFKFINSFSCLHFTRPASCLLLFKEEAGFLPYFNSDSRPVLLVARLPQTVNDSFNNPHKQRASPKFVPRHFLPHLKDIPTLDLVFQIDFSSPA
jgi:hypothetical protein